MKHPPTSMGPHFLNQVRSADAESRHRDTRAVRPSSLAEHPDLTPHVLALLGTFGGDCPFAVLERRKGGSDAP